MSSTYISDSHPGLSLSGPLLAYCNHFLKRHHLNYFQIIRVNRDGSTALLTNQVEFTRFALQRAVKVNVPLVYSCLKKEVLDPSAYYFLWEPNLPAEPVAFARNEFNVCNGLTFVERYPTHYYMIAFAAPSDNHGILDFYLNHIEELRNFIRQFREEQASILRTLEAKPLILPPSQMDENFQDMLLPDEKSIEPQSAQMVNQIEKRQSDFRKNTRMPVNFRGFKSYLTFKEYNCIKLLPLGLSSKQIGTKLELSHRTVEQYFERARNRTGCASKSDLIELLSNK